MRQLSAEASEHSTPGEGAVPAQRGSAGWEFDKLWERYGFKSMVMDRRRRVSTRKGNARFVRVLRRIERRRAERALRRDVTTDE